VSFVCSYVATGPRLDRFLLNILRGLGAGVTKLYRKKLSLFRNLTKTADAIPDHLRKFMVISR